MPQNETESAMGNFIQKVAGTVVASLLTASILAQFVIWDAVNRHDNDLMHFKAMCHKNRDAIDQHEKQCLKIKDSINRLKWLNEK